MITDKVFSSVFHLYDREPSHRTRRLSGYRTLLGTSFLTAEESEGVAGPEVFLDIEQIIALRDWLTEQIQAGMTKAENYNAGQ